jgi:hypothetical protein
MMAIGALLSGSALAQGGFSVNTWTQYKNCPVNDPRMQADEHHNTVCIYGETLKGEKGGFFELGTAKVYLNKPVKIQAGAVADLNEELEIEKIDAIEPTNGKLLESPELKVQGGIKLLTKYIQESQKWPQALTESFKEAVKNKETKVGVTLEVANPKLVYETPNSIDAQNLIEETGTTFILPMKVVLTNPWLAKLGGGPCEIGNEEHPVMQLLSSAPPGWNSPESIHLNPPEYTNAEIADSKLTDLNWPIEAASGPSGCGGAYESYVDGALKQALKMNPNGVGTTVLQGNLFQGKAEVAKRELGL